jgi:hypothetical protein
MNKTFTSLGWVRCVAVIVLFGIGWSVLTASTAPQDPLKDFQARILAYVALNKKANGTVPSVPKNVTDPTIIAQHEQQLAGAIRALRPNAKQGEIFTPAAQKTIAGLSKPGWTEMPEPQSLEKEIRNHRSRQLRSILRSMRPIRRQHPSQPCLHRC